MNENTDIRDDPAFRVGLWYGVVLCAFVFAEEAGVVEMPSAWFLLALIVIMLPSAPAIFRLTPMWRNYFVPFTGPKWSEFPLVFKRWLRWNFGAMVSAIPLAVILKIALG